MQHTCISGCRNMHKTYKYFWLTLNVIPDNYHVFNYITTINMYRNYYLGFTKSKLLQAESKLNVAAEAWHIGEYV